MLFGKWTAFAFVVLSLPACDKDGGMTGKKGGSTTLFDSDDSFEAAMNCRTARKIRASGYRPSILENHQSSDAMLIVDLGVDLPERFDKWATIRVSPTGAAERLELEATGEENWVNDDP